MKKIASVFPAALALLLFAVAAAAQEPVSLAGGRVSFVPPEGFKAMSKEDIEFKFNRMGPSYAPDMVYANEAQSVSVAISFPHAKVGPGQLGELQRVMGSALERAMPGLVWLRREQLEIKGVRWIRLALRARAVDTEVYNDLYMTPFGDKVLMFNFNSTAALYDAHREGLEKSARSITVRQ